MGKAVIGAIANAWTAVKRFCSSLIIRKKSYSNTIRSVEARLEHVLQKLGAESYSYDWSQSRTTCMFWVDWVMPDKRHYRYAVPNADSGKNCEDVSELLEAVVDTLEGVVDIAKFGMLDAESLLRCCLVVDLRTPAKLNGPD